VLWVFPNPNLSFFSFFFSFFLLSQKVDVGAAVGAVVGADVGAVVGEGPGANFTTRGTVQRVKRSENEKERKREILEGKAHRL